MAVDRKVHYLLSCTALDKESANGNKNHSRHPRTSLISSNKYNLLYVREKLAKIETPNVNKSIHDKDN